MSNKLEEILLETLSFYSPMTIEQILLDIDAEKISYDSEYKHLNLEDLKLALADLKRKKYLKTKGKDKTQTWLRVIPRKPWYKKIFRNF